MNAKAFARLVERDKHCLHCGETEAIAPNHRVNRGMGGSKQRDNAANLVVLCSVLNGQIEADARWASLAESYGWKLRSWQEPTAVPVFDTLTGEWRLLDDTFTYKVIKHERDK